MKNILLLPSWYPTPGDPTGGVFIRKHAVEISKHHIVTVLSFGFSDSGTGLWWSSQIQITNSNLTEVRITIRNCGRLLNAVSLFLLSNWLVFKRLTGKIKPDVVHLNVVYHLGVFLFPVLLIFRPKLVVTEHWTGYFPEDGRYRLLNPITRLMISAIFKRASKVIVISPSLKRQLEELFPVDSKTTVVANSLTVPEFPRPLDALSKASVEILTISYMDDRMKGISGLIDAMEQVVKQVSSARLTIVGGGEDLDMLKAYAHCKGLLNKSVFFTGPVPNQEIPDYYRRSAFFVLNSNFESFNIATAEALLHGLPVVVTKCRGPEEYVDSNNGILVDRNSVDQLVAAILEMVNKCRLLDPQLIAEEIRRKLIGEPIDVQYQKVFSDNGSDF